MGKGSRVYWVDLTDLDKDGTFTWASNSTSLDISALWKSGQPDNDCGKVVVYTSVLYDVNPCTYDATVVCQRRVGGAGGAKRRRRRGGFFKRLLKG